jgi:hypothetical protein
MNGLIILLGESFRQLTHDGQGQRNRGTPCSYDNQIKACNSHISFIENMIDKFKLNSMSVFISSYKTQYDIDLLTIYNKYLIGNNLYNNIIGLNNLFHNSIKKIENIEQYDFVLYIRIDLFLKDKFTEVFNPTSQMILFPTICWKKSYKSYGHPRVNDILLFIPKKYYNSIKHINIGHDTWFLLIKYAQLTYEDLDTMIHTYHDSDSYKDYNPLYYIVNRSESNTWHTPNDIFDKYNFS